MEAGLCWRNGKVMSGYALRFTVGVSEPPSTLSSNPCSSYEPDKALFPQGVGAGAEINQDQLWMLLLVQVWWKKLCNSSVRPYKMSVVVVCASLSVWSSLESSLDATLLSNFRKQGISREIRRNKINRGFISAYEKKIKRKEWDQESPCQLEVAFLDIFMYQFFSAFSFIGLSISA